MKTADWIEALRSGKYQQGQHALCKDGNYCCLGVLCEVAGVASRPVGDGDVQYVFTTIGRPIVEECTIPVSHQDKILEDLNLRMMPPTADSTSVADTLHSRLITMNDAGQTFDEIADYIEKVVNES